MNSLNVNILPLIFEYLSLKDLISCSSVSKQWNEAFKITKPKKLFLCYGTKFFPKNKLCLHETFIQSQENNLTPLYVFDNSVLNFVGLEKFENIETFIFYGNNNFVPPESFNLFMFPKLKYVNIMDKNFCDAIQKKFLSFLEEKKEDPNLQWKYFSPSIKTLIMNKIYFSMLLSSLTNIENISIEKFEWDCILNMVECNIKKWRSFEIKKDFYSVENVSKYKLFTILMTECPFLEYIKISICSIYQLKKLLSNPVIKHICIKFTEDYQYLENEVFILPDGIYRDTILEYKDQIKEDYTLCINYFSVKNLNGIINYIENPLVLNHQLEENFEFNVISKTLKLNQYPGIDVLEKYSKLQFIEEVIITNLNKIHLNRDKSLIFHLKQIINNLPKRIKRLRISLNDFISQEVFDLIPKNFEYLEELKIESSRSKITNFKFISNLKFLKNLHLKNLVFDEKEFKSKISTLKFLSKIS